MTTSAIVVIYAIGAVTVLVAIAACCMKRLKRDRRSRTKMQHTSPDDFRRWANSLNWRNFPRE